MSLKDILDFIKEFEGMIGGITGAILGAVSTLIVSHYLRIAGKVTMHDLTSDIKLTKNDKYGFPEIVDRSQAERLEIEINVNFYNSSDIPKPLRNFLLTIENEKETILAAENVRSTGRAKKQLL